MVKSTGYYQYRKHSIGGIEMQSDELIRSTQHSLVDNPESFYAFIKKRESIVHPIPVNRTIRIYVDRLMDQIEYINLPIDYKELGDILNRNIYPATLSEIGLAIDKMITKYDDESLEFLIRSGCGEDFLMGFIMTAGIAPIRKEESKEYLLRVISRYIESSHRKSDLLRRFGSALELIRFIELNTYEEDVVADLIGSFKGGVAFCAGILSGYCNRRERLENGSF